MNFKKLKTHYIYDDFSSWTNRLRDGYSVEECDVYEFDMQVEYEGKNKKFETFYIILAYNEERDDFMDALVYSIEPKYRKFLLKRIKLIEKEFRKIYKDKEQLACFRLISYDEINNYVVKPKDTDCILYEDSLFNDLEDQDKLKNILQNLINEKKIKLDDLLNAKDSIEIECTGHFEISIDDKRIFHDEEYDKYFSYCRIYTFNTESGDLTIFKDLILNDLKR